MSKHIHTRKIRIKKAVPLPSVAVTDKYKDFSKVVGAYTTTIRDIHTKPLYKKPGLFLGLFLVAVIATLVFIAVEEEKAREGGKQIPVNKELIDSLPVNGDSPVTIPAKPVSESIGTGTNIGEILDTTREYH